MPERALMAVFAHPDDESFGVGGTLARYAAQGVTISLICATRGEAGEISDPSLATPERLGQVREAELREACRILGVKHLRFLDYRDGKLARCDFQEAVGKVVRAMRELRPQVVVTFGPEGVYGHPDHVAAHRLATAAFHASGDGARYPEQLQEGLRPHSPQKLYYVAPPRRRFEAFRRYLAETGLATPLPDVDMGRFGVPDEAITATLDIADYLAVKLAAIRSHRTQVSPRDPFTAMPPEVVAQFFKQEHFARAVPPPGEGEADLFAGLD